MEVRKHKGYAKGRLLSYHTNPKFLFFPGTLIYFDQHLKNLKNYLRGTLLDIENSLMLQEQKYRVPKHVCDFQSLIPSIN